MSGKDAEFYIVCETAAQSWLRDIGLYFFVLAVVGTGIALDSAAMQWVGFIAVIAAALAFAKKAKGRSMTIDEAIEHLQNRKKSNDR